MADSLDMKPGSAIVYVYLVQAQGVHISLVKHICKVMVFSKYFGGGKWNGWGHAQLPCVCSFAAGIPQIMTQASEDTSCLFGLRKAESQAVQ